MAAIAFNAAQRAAEWLEAVLTAVGEKFDVFVSYQMQQAAAEGKGAVSLDGKLIDAASIKMAENMVRKADQMPVDVASA